MGFRYLEDMAKQGCNSTLDMLKKKIKCIIFIKYIYKAKYTHKLEMLMEILINHVCKWNEQVV